MKCIKPVEGKKIIRVTNEKAEVMVASSKYTYCPKSEWKEQREKGE